MSLFTPSNFIPWSESPAGRFGDALLAAQAHISLALA
jgi:hypothetical protein